MYETTKKYSESAYYNKQELREALDSYLVEPIWQEICQYRSFFRFDLPVKGNSTYLIRNPFVNDRIAHTQEMIHAWLMRLSSSHTIPFDAFWLHEEEVIRYASMITKMRYDKGMDPLRLFYDIYEQFSCFPSFPLRELLEQPQANLLIKLFFLAMECDKRTAFLLYYPTLYLHHCFALSDLISMEELMEVLPHLIQDMDMTKHFLSFLSKIRLKISDEMVLLNVRAQENSPKLDIKELLERYPNLPKEAIAFYVGHQEPHHYYTLQDYMKEAQVCYETARYSMEKLVEIHWYQKSKVGKKFVYYVM